MKSLKLSAHLNRVIAILLVLISCHNAKAQIAQPKPAVALPHLNVQLLLPGQESTNVSADGLAVYYSNDFTNGIGDEDSYKFNNPDENIAIMREGTLLSMEGRKPFSTDDTLAIAMWKMKVSSYLLKVKLTAFAPGVTSYIQDNYLHTITKVGGNNETIVPFSITTDAASLLKSRFSIVLRSYNLLPIDFSEVKAVTKGRGIDVSWKVENESNIERYEIEQSANALSFVSAAVVRAKNMSATGVEYLWHDAVDLVGSRYYRIKSIDKSGEEKYSEVVKVANTNEETHISVSTTAGAKNSVWVRFTNSRKGNYTCRLVNYNGQTMFLGSIAHGGGSSNVPLKLSNYLPSGVYQLVVSNDDQRQNCAVIIQ